MQETDQENPLLAAKNAINGKLVNELASILLQKSDLQDQERNLRKQKQALDAREREIRAMVKGVEHFVSALIPMTSVVASGEGQPQQTTTQNSQPDMFR
jgi:hypothetical protein